MSLKLRHRLSVINEAASRRVIKQFAAKYHLVYFGRVDSQEDEHQLIRGLTVSTSHTDNHYTVGTVQGHDVMLVQRRNTISFPGKPDAEYKWLIMEVETTQNKLPHLFIDGHRHDETFYANMFVKVPAFQDVTGDIAQRDASFARKYHVFGLPNQFAQINAVLTPEVTGTITQHFHQFDFEFIEDRVCVYAAGHVVTLATLQEMLRVSVWLADALNAAKLPD